MHLTRRIRGVTLLELLIVVTILGVLIAFAYPNYRDFTARAERTEAKAKLLEIATLQERFYLSENRYGTLPELGYSDPLLTESGRYTLTITANDAVNFTATAAYNHSGGELGRCTTISLDGRGNKTSTGSVGNCWIDQR